MDPSPLHSLKTGVDFWKLLSDGFTMGGGKKRRGCGGRGCFEGTNPQNLTFHLAVFRCAVVLDYMG